MRLHGSTEGNLIAALGSARRLRGSPVHEDTLRHWTDLIQHADGELASGAAAPREPMERLVAELKTELGSRRSLRPQKSGVN
jgi:hypothetical protein